MMKYPLTKEDFKDSPTFKNDLLEMRKYEELIRTHLVAELSMALDALEKVSKMGDASFATSALEHIGKMRASFLLKQAEVNKS